MISQQNEQHEPVAIVGMGCRWPGGSHDTTAFWEFLCNKVDGWKKFGYPRFSAEGFHHPNADRPGGFAMKGAYLVEQDARLFDHSFFGMTGLEVETMDPSQRKLLEVAYEAIENAGETWDSISGTRTGVFVGNFCLDHWMIQSRDWDNPRPYAFVGAGTSILANRISYIFNLQGPSLTIDTACSSSMYALHLAVNAIRAGDCDSAIVASANWIGDPGVQIALDKLGALSASSRCHTFDARAEGYARGEGYGAIYLKRPSLAIAHSSPIRAMIRGTAINSNGRTGGITRPSVKGQENVIREAYRSAGGLPYQDTSYFECHGTGTYVGDPIEMAAVGKVFAEFRSSDDPLLVGSVKSNVGHGEGASALASVMKVVLALERNVIPPIFDLRTRNPNIDFEGANVLPVTELTPWPKDRLRRASINSFGYGGANAHCIIDHVENVIPEYVGPGIFKASSHGQCSSVTRLNGVGDVPSTKVNGAFPKGIQSATTNGVREGPINSLGMSIAGSNTNGALTNGSSNNSIARTIIHEPILQAPALTAAPKVSTRELVLLPISGHNENSLRQNVKHLSEVIENFQLADVAYTLSDKRSRYAQRSFCIVDKTITVQDLVIDRKPTRAPLQQYSVGFIFTGQGAQWHGMGAELLEYRVFRKAIEYLDQVLQTLPNSPTWSLRAILSCECDAALVHTAEIAQAICTAVQVGLVDLLASWSVRPAGVAGHSSGEIAAAYASGHISAAEAIIAAYLRGQAVSKNTQAGAMLAVGLGLDDVNSFLQGLEDRVKVAAINSPGSVTLSGETDTIDKISAAMTASNVFNRKLKTGGNAYHSHHMLPIGQDYIDMLARGTDSIDPLVNDGLKQYYPRVPWVSSVTPHKEATDIDNFASYWRANLESPVRFSEAVARLVNREDDPIHVLVEIGPHPALKSPVEQIVKSMGKTIAYTSTLKRQEDGRRSLLQLAGSLFCLNAPVNLTAVNAMDVLDGKTVEHGCTCTDLPPYQYTYTTLNYHESRSSKEYRYRSVIRHDLLGSKVVGTAKLRPQWRNILRMKDVPWLGHHRLLPDAVFPGAAYLAMATEAAARIYNEYPESLRIDGFEFMDVAIEKGLVIPEDDYGVEVLTSMELLYRTTAQSTSWATFSISSVGRETQEWTEHCTGRVKVIVKQVDEDARMFVPTNRRAADASAWYRKFAEMGLGYGPSFQPLSNISTNISDSNVAVATLSLHTTAEHVKGGESHYPLHPASLDGAIQLGLIACYGGKHTDATTAFVPVRLGRFYLSNGFEQNANDTCIVIARGQRRGIRGAHLDLHLLGRDGKILAQVGDLRCVSFSNIANVDDKVFSSPFTRLVWQPDIRSLSNEQACRLFPPPEDNVRKAPSWAITNKLAHFVVFSIFYRFEQLDNKPTPTGDVGHFYDWIRRNGHNDSSLLINEARKLAIEGKLLRTIEDLVFQAPDVMEVRIAKLLHDNMEDILYERRTGIDVILAEELLTPLYQSGLLMTGIYPQLHRVLSGLAHSNPNARILEIGGGTGGATRIAMQAFNGPNGIKAYRDYTFTDISAGFLSGARESMAHLHDMNFSVFDIEVDPVDQGYLEQAYDLIIACQVLHATSNMHRTLTNCRRLLKPGGKLILVETTENFIVPGVVVGTFTGYWAGIPDGRVDAPFQSLPNWDRSLREAGFSGLDIVLDDFPVPHNTTSVILSTVPLDAPQLQPVHAAPVFILYGSEPAPSLSVSISEALQQHGVPSTTGTFDAIMNVLPSDSRVIAFFDDTYDLSNCHKDELHMFQQLSRNVASLVALTSCGVVDGRNADGALISGLLRVLQNENPATDYTSIDIETSDFEIQADEAKDLVRFIVDHGLGLHQGLASESLDSSPRDREFSWRHGCAWVSRHVPDAGFHSQHGLSTRNLKPELLPLESEKPVRATFELPGVLSSLCFTSYTELSQPLQPDFIDVEVSAIGLNAHDLDHWTGRIDEDSLSSEYAGTVKAVGADVTDLKVGDRVYGLGQGHFGNYTRVPAALANKVDCDDDFVQIASMPVAYSTAIYALEFVTRLQTGQSVLVQSNATGLAVALISLAKLKGADVFALVDGTDQAASLVDELGIPMSHVVTSVSSLLSSLSTAQVQITPKFDVVISSAQGESLGPILEVLAPLGHFVSLRRDSAHSAPTISLEKLPQNACFSRVDLFTILNTNTGLAMELMQRVTSYYRQGLIGPIPNITAIDVANLGSAIVNQVGIVGKMVVSFANGSSVRTVPSPPSLQFDPQSCYVITGALGGLGQSLIQWMADRGAKHLALLSRRDATTVPSVQNLLKALGDRGVQSTCYVCDVSDKSQVTGAIQEIAAQRSIKGVVHAAVSYLDRTFDTLSLSRWTEGLSAKVAGTKNLHEALLGTRLDFFVMTTSALSVFAFPTQGAYTAANNFQDAFARYRRRLGLPASTISFSLIQEVSEVGKSDLTINLFERNKALALDESGFLQRLESAFLNNKTADPSSPNQWAGQLHDPLSAANLHTYLDPAAMLAKEREDLAAGIPASTASPRWHSDGRVSLMRRALADAKQRLTYRDDSHSTGSKTTVTSIRKDFHKLVAEGASSRAAAVTFVQEAITSAVAEMLFVDVEGIDPNKSVADLGVDSLIAAELRNWFLQALEAGISMLDLLDPGVSIAARAEGIVARALEVEKK